MINKLELKFPHIDTELIVAEDADRGEVELALGACGINDLMDLRVDSQDIRLQRTARELSPEEAQDPATHIGIRVLELVAGQVPGDRIKEDGTHTVMPRVVGLSDVQVWTPRQSGQRGAVQMSLIPHPDHEVVRGIQPVLQPVANLKVVERSEESVWSFEGCFSVVPKHLKDKVYALVRHPKWVEYTYLDPETGEQKTDRVDDDDHVGPVLHEERHNEGRRFEWAPFVDRLYVVPEEKPELLNELREMPRVPFTSYADQPHLSLPKCAPARYDALTSTGFYRGVVYDSEARKLAKAPKKDA